MLIILMIAGCGGAARKNLTDSNNNVKNEHEQFLEKYQAMDHFSKADLLEKSGNLEKAADEYRLALVYDPASGELKRELARVYYRLQKYDEALNLALRITGPQADDIVLIAECYKLTGNQKMALKNYKSVAALDSTIDIPNKYLAAYYSEKGDLRKADYYYRRFIGNDSTSARWWYNMAAFYIESNQLDKASHAYRRMISIDSTGLDGHLGLALIEEKKNNIPAADTIYNQLAESHWDDAQTLTALSQSIIRINDLKSAVRIIRRITELYPDDYLSLRRFALLSFSLGDRSCADSVLDILVKAVPDDPISYFYKARIAQQDSLFPKSESLFIKTLSLDDTLVEAWGGLAFARGVMADTEGALATFDSALVAGGDSTHILFLKATFLSQAKRYSNAIDYYNRVLLVDPKNIGALFGLGAAYERTSRYEESERSFLALLKLAPEHAGASNYLGFMWADRGVKLKPAEKLIKKALDLDPNNGAYLDSYAWVLYKAGKFKEALTYQEKALKSDTKDAVLFDHLGDIYAALKQPAKAQESWQRALELDPSNATIKDKLAK